MTRITKTKNVIKALVIVFSVALVIILLNFGVHVVRTNNYNSQLREIDQYSDTTDVMVDIHPRGLATDSWEKNDAFEGVILKAKIYEASVINNSGALLHDWDLKINIKADCYVNNAWNGEVEVHQFVNGTEKVQRLSLQDYSADELTLDYFLCGQDLLIPLSKGDYIIYKPCALPSLNENEINSTDDMTGQQDVGIIFYSLTGDEDLTDYDFTYYLKKSIWEGREAALFTVLMPIWCIAVLILVIVGVLTNKYEKRISLQNAATIEFLEVFAEFVDSKKENNDGHSKEVARTARLICKKMGMNDRDCDSVYYTALVHDIGKCHVPDYVLKKKGALTYEEQELIKTHTSKGAEMVKDCKTLPFLYEGVLYHHERFDGNGYPSGKSGENIPLVARVINLADSFVSLSSPDDHDIKPSKEMVISEILAESGKQFDPVLVDAFVEVLRESDKETWEEA